MAVQILVATPQAAFGELIRLSLEESGRCSVRLAHSGREVVGFVGRLHFDLAVLDAALADEPLEPLGRALIVKNPGLRLVILPADGDPTAAALKALQPQAVLSLPFYLPELLETVERLAGKGAAAAPAAPAAAPAALTGRKEVGVLLARGLAGNPAVAAVVLQNNLPWAWAGSLEEAILKPLADQLSRSWKEGSHADIARYMRLPGGREYLVYATSLQPGAPLMVICDPATPLTRIRSLTGRIAQGLRENLKPAPPVEPPPAAAASEPAFVPENPTPPPAPEPAALLQEMDNLFASAAPQGQEADDLLAALAAASDQPPPDKKPAEEETDANLEISLSDLLAAMPSPDPETRAHSAGAEWVLASESETDDHFLFPWEMEANAIKNEIEGQAAIPTPAPEILPPTAAAPAAPTIETQPEITALPAAALAPGETILITPAAPSTPAETEPAAARGDTAQTVNPPAAPRSDGPKPPPAAAEPTRPVTPVTGAPSSIEDTRRNVVMPRPAVPASVDRFVTETIAETRPNPRSAPPQVQDVEPLPQDYSGLSYTCVLLPRLPHHQLSGLLSEELSAWLVQICLAYGWRLGWQAIQLDCFQWGVYVSPSISPGIVVRLIRQLTSQRIFEHYPILAQDNFSGDFWAPGYLIISGAHPPEAAMINNYIQQTRKRQGI